MKTELVTASRDISRITRHSRSRPATASRPAGILPVLLLLLAAVSLPAASLTLKSPVVLLEAEQFAAIGGWVVDQQFMDQMGSPYLLAHGLGEPVRDAQTTVRFPAAGKYRVWVRTRDWVAPWKVSGAPGRFKVLINGKPLATTFGTEGAAWHWQDGGTVKVGREAKVALHDLTGFEGRCDAILFCRDLGFKPPNESFALAAFRRQALGLPEAPEDGGSYDLVVVGGGIAGTCAALSAARQGLKVALLQDRPVLGGNNSSEVRVWLGGGINLPPYPRIGDIVAELEPSKRAHYGEGNTAELYEDDRRLALVRSEPNINLLLEQRVNAVEAVDGVIRAVVAQHIRTARRVRLAARWIADCTGDGAVGALAGADSDTTLSGHMGPSNLWHVKDTGQPEPFPKCVCDDTNALNMTFAAGKDPAPFPRCPWAIDLRDKPFPGRQMPGGKEVKDPLRKLGAWYWESGFDRDPIADAEWIRDQNFRAMYGAWDTLKNVDKVFPNHKLNWAAFIAGKRESRRLLGDVILTGDDFRTNRFFPDASFPCTWSIDLHLPDPAFDKGHQGVEFISRASFGKYPTPYWAPYRCLYSRNVKNLFMAGRDISVTHEALGPVRVMRTCGTMGEIVGMAASLCKQHDCNPRAVYEQHLDKLKQLMERGAGREAAKALP
ncbi:MAG TPA: FAD-dependent oxidoreductase [Candidatus Paceibacterota bacterium]|nr:FAD-dependent oxidoreductase [Verrucomicrobiota bacterium]HSA09258.1 FAD-dependent oxidoreductase [Candidatus Paceibacterota bacterium]